MYSNQNPFYFQAFHIPFLNQYQTALLQILENIQSFNQQQSQALTPLDLINNFIGVDLAPQSPLNNFIKILMPHNSGQATFTARDVLNLLLKQAQTIANSNQFVRDNLVTFIIDKQELMLFNIFHQYLFLPQQNRDKEDQEAHNIPEDNLMNVSEVAPDTRVLDINYKSKGAQSKKSESGLSKAKTVTERKEVPAYKSITKGLDMNDQQNQQAIDYISKLRAYKERQERQKAALSPLDKQKQKPKIIKGQKVVFDYQGNALKGAQAKNSHFKQQVLQSSIENASKNSIQHNKQDKSSTIVTKLLDRSNRNRTQVRGSMDFSNDKRELIIQNLKLSNSKVKMVFDGHNVTRIDEENKQNLINFSQKRSQFKANKASSPASQHQKAKTQLSSLQVSLPLNQRPQRKIRARVHTQAQKPQKPQKSQRIKIDSQAFKKAMMTQPDDIYLQLPKNRIRRAATNQTAGHSSNDTDLLKIREKLNIKKSSEKLPHILSKFSNLQKDLIKEIRKKSKIIYHDNS